jgi:hypothetical protein
MRPSHAVVTVLDFRRSDARMAFLVLLAPRSRYLAKHPIVFGYVGNAAAVILL